MNGVNVCFNRLKAIAERMARYTEEKSKDNSKPAEGDGMLKDLVLPKWASRLKWDKLP